MGRAGRLRAASDRSSASASDSVAAGGSTESAIGAAWMDAGTARSTSASTLS